MNGITGGNKFPVFFIVHIILLLLAGCGSSKKYSGFTTVRKYQKNIPFVYKNNITLKAPEVGNDERISIKSKLNTQLDDSARVRIKDVAFVFHYITRPPAFDPLAVFQSAENMKTALVNIGYYHPQVTYHFDTVLYRTTQKRVVINYDVVAGKRTLVDTLAYSFSKQELEDLALSTKKSSPLQKNSPVSKSAISQESGRLVDLYRNHGYYKFTADEIRVTGDTSIKALTTVSEDPFEQLRLLSEANQQRDKPTIRLQYQLNSTPDTSRLKKYYVNNIYVLPDYVPGELYMDSSFHERVLKNYITRYHRKLFKFRLPASSLYLKKGDVFSQDDYFKTINSFYRLGAWESPTVDILEKKDSNLLDLVIKLVPIKKYALEGNIELSYSANNTTSNITTANAGNLLGVAGNLSITNRNLWKQAARLTNAVRVGVEFNTAHSNNGNGSSINSREISYTNNILFPKFITPFKNLNRKKFITKQSFINTNVSLINRVDFFDQQVFNIGLGYNWTNNENHIWSYKPFNFDYHRIYNRSALFDTTLKHFPFLRYSFNTALVMGQSLSYKAVQLNAKNPKIVNTIKANLEESGLLWGVLKLQNKNAQTGNFFNKYLKEFIKTDVDLAHTINHPKSAIIFRGFAGVGIPLSRSDTTLPFFKQYFGGGPNSMRGWPVRGIGVGGQALAPYSDSLFNDRTGDIQLEGNVEYRFNVAPLFSNAILFKMALFADVGNVWNFKNTKPDGSPDTTQFRFQNLYRQLGVSSGLGFRFDFNYFLIRFDIGFRFKRPDVIKNDGWQIPAISFKNLFGTSLGNRIWRYENFNATIGIDYPF
jgi:outer membrane protein insertion porin family